MTAPPLKRFVDQTKGEVLVLHDQVASSAVAELGDVVLCCTDDVPPEPRARWAAVILAVADSAALRRIAPALPRLGRARAIACWLTETDRALALTQRPGWPSLGMLQARLLASGAGWTTARFEGPVLINAVLEQLARDAVPAKFHRSAGIVIAVPPNAEPPGTVVPPDIVLGFGRAFSAPVYDVTSRPAAVVNDPDLVRGPLDEGVLNPTGFVQRPGRGMVDLRADESGDPVVFGLPHAVKVEPARGATAVLVTALREHQGVRVDWAGGDTAMTTLVAGLAMAGVPLSCVTVPDDVASRLGPSLSSILGEVVDLGEPLRREEHSVRLRRAALLSHSTLGWGARLAEAAGLPHRRFPTCTIVLATKRPGQLEFALRQVARQTGAEVELVVAAHGFAPDKSWVQERVGHPASVLAISSETYFGDVLNAGVRASSGDLIVKMDDDDWYGPDFITDLMLARHYSGADITGTTAEFVYLEALDRTIRRNDRSERNAKFVAGGTIMVERGYLAALGGFRPVRRFVDAQLLAATAALGGSVYRTHGLGYVLRRSAEGHTWDADDDYFLDPARLDQQWAGFSPSHLLTHDPADVPVPRERSDRKSSPA